MHARGLRLKRPRYKGHFAARHGYFARFFWLWLLAAVLLAGCGRSGDGPAGGAPPGGGDPAEDPPEAASGESVEVGKTEALVWDVGDYGVVMAHGAAYDAASWEEQARRISGEGVIALAVEDTSPRNLLAAVEYLKEERGAEGVALLGASAGGSDALRTAWENPRVADQLILLSATGKRPGLARGPSSSWRARARG